MHAVKALAKGPDIDAPARRTSVGLVAKSRPRSAENSDSQQANKHLPHRYHSSFASRGQLSFGRLVPAETRIGLEVCFDSTHCAARELKQEPSIWHYG
jgi:hypothetical protein